MTQCRICGAPGGDVVYAGPVRAGRFGNVAPAEYSVLRCSGCGVDRLDPPPENTDAYESGEYREAVDGSREVAAYHALHDVELSSRLALIGSAWVRGKVVMDVGCGAGAFLDVLKGIAARTIGVEPQVEFGRAIRENGHEHYAYPADFIGAGTAAVDIAFSFQVLEHVADPRAFLVDVLRCLKPGGRLHLTTPNRAEILMATGPASYKRFFYRLVHLWYFDRESLARVAEIAGFEVVELSTPHHYDLSNFAVWLRDERPSGLGMLPELSGVADAAFRAQVSGSGRGGALYAVLERPS